MKRFLSLGGLAVLVILSPACGDQKTTVTLPLPTQTFAPQPPVSSADPNWDNPIEGQPVAAADAARYLAFTPLAPKGLGTPASVLVQLLYPQVDTRSVAYLFNHPTYGRVIVVENIPDISLADYQAALIEWGSINPSDGKSETIVIRNAITALLTQTNDGSQAALRWLEGSIAISVRGPELQRDEIIAIANAL